VGRLIQQGEPKDAAGLRQCLESICGENIALRVPGLPDNHRWEMPEQREPDLDARKITRTVADNWRVTSYSGLQQHGQSIAQDLMPKLDVDAAGVGDAG
jgi:exodeoxyribonuclease V beta subunit